MRKRLLFVIPRLGGGGAEKVMLTLLNHLNRGKYELHLCLIQEEGNYFDQLKNDVECHLLDCKRFSLSLGRLFGCIKRVKPDIVIGFLSFVVVYLALLKATCFRNTIFIARETGLPSSRNKLLVIHNNFFCAFAYRSMTAVVSQCRYQKKELGDIYKIAPGKIAIIPNPTNCSLPLHLPPARNDRKIHLVTAGALSMVKNQASAIEAIRLCRDNGIVLHIFGQGPLRSRLLSQINAHNLENRIMLHGFEANLKRQFLRYDAYLMTSRIETCSNALLEAQACGLPAIAFDCPGANSEIIREGETGFLVPRGDVEFLAKVISERKYLNLDRQKIRQNIIDRYAIDKSLAAFEALIDQTGGLQ